jgi:hypothetical protein
MKVQLVGMRAVVAGASAEIPRCSRKGTESDPEVQSRAAEFQEAGTFGSTQKPKETAR